MFSFKELIKAYEVIDEFNLSHEGKYRMSCHSDSKGLHVTVVDKELESIYSWQPFASTEELREFVTETCW